MVFVEKLIRFFIFTCASLLFVCCESEVFNGDNPLKGKSIAVFGGSIPMMFDDYYGLADSLESKYGCLWNNYAESSQGYANKTIINEDGTVILGGVPMQIDKYIYENRKDDIYLLWSSTNDYTSGDVLVGDIMDYTVYDSYDRKKLKTQAGGLNYSVQKLKSYNPNAVIVIFGSLKMFSDTGGYQETGQKNKVGVSLYDLVLGQELIAQEYDMPFYSLWEVPFFTEENFQDWYSDTIHPNRQGFCQIFSCVSSALCNSVCEAFSQNMITNI